MTSPAAAPAALAHPEAVAARLRPTGRHHSAGRLRRLAGQVVVAVAWTAVGNMLALVFSGLPVVSLLGTTSITFVTASVLFGWVGVVVAMLMRLAYGAVLGPLTGLYPWLSTLAYGAAGALAWCTFRYLPRLGRSFPDSRTFGWFTAVAGVGGVLSSTVISITGSQAEDVWSDIALWSRATVVSVWVFAPALLVMGQRFLRPWLSPVPEEAVAVPLRRVALVQAALPGEPPQVVDVETSEVSVTRGIWVAALMVAVITAGKMLFSGASQHGYVWWNLLYMVPIWWLAQGWRTTGAVLGFGIAGAAALGSDAAIAALAPLSNSVSLAIYARLLAFWLVGALLGRSAEREGRLLDGLADLHHRLEQDLQRVVKALTGAVEAKDAYTEGHLQRVNAYALEVGRRLGLPPRDLELLQIASTLHDIGKIGIPEQVLSKPGALSFEERQVMQRHPEIGARLLSRTEGLREAAPLVLHHQERWDGRREGEFPGYPGGLSGEAIPLGARIIAVVDAFDAMTTDRPYRKAMPAVRARDVLEAERGAQFDPGVVDVFLSVLDDRPWR